MGLILDNNKFAVLTDILGDEDHLGDMDFKVAGTTEGVTALQMDIKIQGITKEIMQIALAQAKEARLHILDQMKAAVAGPQELSAHAPRLFTMKINQDKIRDVIGKGGETIRSITAETGTEINIAETVPSQSLRLLKKQANALLATAEAEHRLIFGASDGDAVTGMEPFLPATDTGGNHPPPTEATGAEHLAHSLNSAGIAKTWPVGQSPMDIILRASDSPVIHAQAEFAEHFTQDLIQHIHAVTPEYFEQIVADIFTTSWVLVPR